MCQDPPLKNAVVLLGLGRPYQANHTIGTTEPDFDVPLGQKMNP